MFQGPACSCLPEGLHRLRLRCPRLHSSSPCVLCVLLAVEAGVRTRRAGQAQREVSTAGTKPERPSSCCVLLLMLLPLALLRALPLLPDAHCVLLCVYSCVCSKQLLKDTRKILRMVRLARFRLSPAMSSLPVLPLSPDEVCCVLPQTRAILASPAQLLAPCRCSPLVIVLAWLSSHLLAASRPTPTGELQRRRSGQRRRAEVDARVRRSQNRESRWPADPFFSRSLCVVMRPLVSLCVLLRVPLRFWALAALPASSSAHHFASRFPSRCPLRVH